MQVITNLLNKSRVGASIVIGPCLSHHGGSGGCDVVATRHNLE